MKTLPIVVLYGMLAVLLVSSASVAQVAAPSGTIPVSPVLSPEVAKEYTRAHQLVDIGHGRKINLFCMGSGDVTVIFDSGLSDWSLIWALVQPAVAKRARACSYDRAGMGFSDIATEALARSPAAIIDDLHSVIRATKINTPVVLVGHSLGGFNMKLYAATYPADVAALVLVDPSEDREYARTAEAIKVKYGAAVAAQMGLHDIMEAPVRGGPYAVCATAADKHDLDPASDLYKKCTDPVREPLGPVIAAERQRLQVGAAYQNTQASELANSVYGDSRFDAVYARLFSDNAFGDKPMIVLTHSIHNQHDPLAEAEYYGLNLMHEQTAALSTRGVNRIVRNTHHNIEVDQPQAIIDAVDEVIASVSKH